MKVITYQAPQTGATIHLTPDQISRLREAGTWPKDPRTGQEYCQVQHGLHWGTPEADEDIGL